MVIAGREEAAGRFAGRLPWDVCNGISRRSWARNAGACDAIRREMSRNPLLQVTLPYMADDDVVNGALD
ncbi:MAG: urocanate hydratase, partial [Muribaculaceae bacterium]|nr:urocanate hydratase [Muribaculaceae bacterium]